MNEFYRKVNHKGNGRKARLHTNSDCYRLQRAIEYKPVERSNHPDAKICPACAGTEDRPQTQDRSLYQTLKRMGEQQC